MISLRLVVIVASGALLPGCSIPGKPANTGAGRDLVLFDGRSLGDLVSSGFGGDGEIFVEDGALILDQGSPLTGVTWQGAPLPRTDYRLEFSAARLLGNDFFCGLTFPVGDDHLTLILGGWGGALCGISSLDGRDASENETTCYRSFTTGQYYRVGLDVRTDRIEITLDAEVLLTLDLRGRRLGLRPEVDRSRPLGWSSFATRAGLRHIRLTVW